MAKEKYIELVKQGKEAWNSWIETRYPESGKVVTGKFLHDAMAKIEDPDLSGCDFSGQDLSNYKFYYTDLSGANLHQSKLCNTSLHKSNLRKANLKSADLTRARLYNTDLRQSNCSSAKFTHAWLRGAKFLKANLDRADFTSADLTKANLSGSSLYKTRFRSAILKNVRMLSARLVETNFEKAKLLWCAVYGISAWNLDMEGATQKGFVITPKKHPNITVDNLEVAQFIYLLLHDNKLRELIDTVTTKVVLILGRFTTERKSVLNSISDELRKRDYLPIIFDFEGPQNRDFTETISTLAHLARFIIADITSARSIPQELQRIIPDLPSVPVQPILHTSKREYGMFEHLKRFDWVLDTCEYSSREEVISSIESIINRSEEAVHELREG